MLWKIKKMALREPIINRPESSIDDNWSNAAKRNKLDKDRFNLIASLLLKDEKTFIDIGACSEHR